MFGVRVVAHCIVFVSRERRSNVKTGITSTFIMPISGSRLPSYLGICLFSHNDPGIQLLIACHSQMQCNTLYQELHFREGEAESNAFLLIVPIAGELLHD